MMIFQEGGQGQKGGDLKTGRGSWEKLNICIRRAVDEMERSCSSGGSWGGKGLLPGDGRVVVSRNSHQLGEVKGKGGRSKERSILGGRTSTIKI